MDIVNENNFHDFLDNKVVLLDFFAQWCRPCHALVPVLETLSEIEGVKVGKVDVDENPELAMDYNISAVPTLLLFNGGTLVKRFVGMQSEASLREAILRVMSGNDS